MVKVKGKVD